MACPNLNLAELCCRRRANWAAGVEKCVSDRSNVINFRKAKPAPAVQLPIIVWAVVGLIIAIFGGLQLAGPAAQNLAVYEFAFIPARFGSAPFEQATGAKWWSTLTYGFLHASWSHVLLNSLWLAVFSKPVQILFWQSALSAYSRRRYHCRCLDDTCCSLG